MRSLNSDNRWGIRFAIGIEALTGLGTAGRVASLAGEPFGESEPRQRSDPLLQIPLKISADQSKGQVPSCQRGSAPIGEPGLLPESKDSMHLLHVRMAPSKDGASPPLHQLRQSMGRRMSPPLNEMEFV